MKTKDRIEIPVYVKYDDIHFGYPVSGVQCIQFHMIIQEKEMEVIKRRKKCS